MTTYNCDAHWAKYSKLLYIFREMSNNSTTASSGKLSLSSSSDQQRIILKYSVVKKNNITWDQVFNKLQDY